MKTKANVLVLAGYGLNCEEETLRAFTMVGCAGDIVHLNDLIATPQLLKRYNVLVFPGGFSYGDDTGSGRAYANRIKNNIGEEIDAFTKRDTLTLGICNGFQILTQIGLLPGTLLHNASARYIDRWVDVEVSGTSPWLKGIDSFSLPIAHGEGNYFIDERGLEALESENAVAGRYVCGETTTFSSLEANPNGSIKDIAGVLANEGRILGMMPHPERAVSFLQLPHWTYLKETTYRGRSIPKKGPGLALFENAANYFAS